MAGTVVARLEAILGADTRGFDKAMDQSESRMHSVRKTAGVAGAAIVGGLALGLEKSVHAAMEAQTSQSRLEVAFKTAGLSAGRYRKNVDDLEQSGRKLGFTDEQTKSSLGSLLVATHDMAKATNNLGVAQDIARFKHIDLIQATKMLTMAQAGSQRATKQLGISIQQNTSQQDELKAKYQALTPAMRKATEETYKHDLSLAKVIDKQKTASIVIQTVRAKLEGQADAYSKTAAGGMEQFRAQTDHLEVAMGRGLLPIMTTVATTLANLTEFFAKHTTVTKVLVISLGILGGVLLTISASMKIAAAAVKIYTAAQWLMNAAMDANPIGLVVIALAALAVGVVVAYKKFKPFREAVNAAWGALQDVFGWVKDHWPELAVLLAGPFAPIVAAGTDAFGVRTAIVKTFDSIKSFITDFPNKVTNFISALKSKIVGWLTSADIGGYFSSVVGGWVAFVTGMPGRVTDFIAVLKKKIVGFFTTNAIGDYIFSVVGGWVGFITGLPGRVGDFVVALKNKIVGFFIDNDIGGYITAVVAGWIGTIGDLPGKAGAAITAGAKLIKNAVTNLFGNVIEWVKKALGISSPSAVFHEMGRQSVQGFINGVGSMAGVLKNAVVHIAESALSHLNPFAGGTTLPPYTQKSGGLAAGFLPAGAIYVKERKDEGRDFITNPGGSIIAPGAGVVTGIHSDPNGFGPNYPTVRFSSGLFKGREMYIGHTHAALATGAHFGVGQRLAVTGFGTNVGNATVPGWAEIGFWPPSWSNPAPFARGGIIRRPMFAMMGEEGPEAIIPLSPNRKKEAAGILSQISPQVGLQSWQDKTLEFFKSLWNVAKPFYGGAAMPMLNFVEKGIDITRSFVSGPSHGPNTPGSRTVNWTHAASNALFGNKEWMRQWALDAALHEWVHIFQKPDIFGTPWKAEGGAVDFVRMMGKKIYSMLGIDYTPGSVGGQYEGWATRVMKELGPTWVLRDQFRDPRAVAGLKSAVFDKGGWLQPGLTLAANNTGRPEPVGGGGNVTINYNGTIIHEREAEQRIVDLLARAQRRGPLGLSGGFA